MRKILMVYGPSTNYSQPYYAAARPEIPNPGLSYSTPQPPQLGHIDTVDTKELGGSCRYDKRLG